jgi:alpha-tubulin suppressor-like RCC1 family protein
MERRDDAVQNARQLIVALVVASVALSACDRAPPGPRPVVSIAVDPSTATLASLGESVQLTATARDDRGKPISGTTVSWESSDQFIARVDGSGRVTAVQNGPVVISARAEGVVGTAAVEVRQVPARLAFTAEPTGTFVESPITPAVAVTLRDARDNRVAGSTDRVTLTLGTNPTGGSLLRGTSILPVDGVATFRDVSVDRPGAGYTLVASTSTQLTTTSVAFDATSFVTLAAGQSHVCGIGANGKTYCWGANAGPTPKAVSTTIVFSSLTAGAYHTCGLTQDGTAYCWGTNSRGQLGNPAAPTPTESPLAVAGGLKFGSLDAGGEHTCGIAVDGVTYCWGDNRKGQLGDGAAADHGSPEPVAGTLRFASVTAGAEYTCALTEDGATYCWGYNIGGVAGDPLTRTIPARVAEGLTFTSLTAGFGHVCGITAAGAAFCWGSNFDGRLGDGTQEHRATPVPVSGGLTFQSIGPGCAATCGVTTTGAVYCWGRNLSGELGDGRTTSRPVPGPIVGPPGIRTASVGCAFACGLTGAGGACCWGSNSHGELGNATMSQSAVPVRVVGRP